MRRIIIIIITCICVQWVAMAFLVYREGMQLPLVAMVLREASALMRTSSMTIDSVKRFVIAERLSARLMIAQ